MSHDADVLNLLVARLRSASAGYRRAGADGPGLSDAFGGAAEAHDQTAEALSAMIRAIEGGPVAADTDLAHHAWSDLPRAAAAGPRALAETVERAENELLRAFQSALDDPDVSSPVHDAVASALHGVKAGHASAQQRLAALDA